MSDAVRTDRPAFADARLRPRSTLFVCRECSLGKARRRAFKDALKATGRKRDLRVVACGCLDVCPKRGTTVVLAGASGPARPGIVDDAADAAAVLADLLDEGVRNPVPD